MDCFFSCALWSLCFSWGNLCMWMWDLHFFWWIKSFYYEYKCSEMDAKWFGRIFFCGTRVVGCTESVQWILSEITIKNCFFNKSTFQTVEKEIQTSNVGDEIESFVFQNGIWKKKLLFNEFSIRWKWNFEGLTILSKQQ